jgi:hypothetical protein
VACLLAVAPLLQQHHYPFQEQMQADNLGVERVPQVPALQEWMTERGLPTIPERWRHLYADFGEMHKDAPALVDYLRDHFYPNYTLFLLTHPEYTLTTALDNAATLLDTRNAPAVFGLGHGPPICDWLWDTIQSYVGFTVLVLAALIIEPWAGVAALIPPVLVYHANVNEFGRLLAVSWAWQWICGLLVLHRMWAYAWARVGHA